MRRNLGQERAEAARERIRARSLGLSEKIRKARQEKEMSVCSGGPEITPAITLDFEGTKVLLNAVLSCKNREPVSAELKDFFAPIPRIRTNNGSSVSMQAGKSNYSHPREAAERYDSVELGFFETKNPLSNDFRPYFDGTDDEYPNGVFGYVPMDLVVKWVMDNGGLVTDDINPGLINPVGSSNSDFGTW